MGRMLDVSARGGMVRVGWALVLSLTAMAAAEAEKYVLYYAHTRQAIPAAKFNKAFIDFGGTPTDTHASNGIAFRLFIEDIRQNTNSGYDGVDGPAAIARLKDALTEVAATLNESGTLDILINEGADIPGSTLASAGTFYSTTPGFTSGIAQRRLFNDTKPAASFPEVVIDTDFGTNWNFTDAATTGGKFDFMTVMIHEMAHALGFASLIEADGTSAISANVYADFDRFIVRNQGGTNLVTNPGPSFTGNVSDLTSNALFHEGANAVAGYGQTGVQPGIYAPSPYNDGSSTSHWDTGNIIGGAVMEHALSPNEDIRAYRGVDVGALVDIGYASAAVTGGEGEGEGEPLVWTDFDYNGVELGTQSQPYNTLAESVAAVAAGGTVRIKTGETPEIIRCTKLLVLEAFDGGVRIGVTNGAFNERTIRAGQPVDNEERRLDRVARRLLRDFARLDRDGSAGLSPEEQEISHPITPEQWLALDTNGDGILSQHELEDAAAGGQKQGCFSRAAEGSLLKSILEHVAELLSGLVVMTVLLWSRRQQG